VRFMDTNIWRKSGFALFAGIVLLASASTFAQAQEKPAGQLPAERQPAAVAPKPGGADAASVASAAAPVDPKSYKIGSEDVLNIRVWKEPELSGSYTVRPDGKITLPLAGDVQAANVTPLELTKNVTDVLKKYINNPEVTVAVAAVLSKKYYITGEVGRTGAFPLVTPTTVLEALTGAGGFRDFANTKNIVVLRGTKRYKFNYKDFIKGKNLEQNIFLENGDYIIVP
jgi:polysaccharide biosynthesis/export protein